MFAALTGVVAAGVGFIAGGTLHTEIWKVVNKEKYRQLTQVQIQCCNCIVNYYSLQVSGLLIRLHKYRIMGNL